MVEFETVILIAFVIGVIPAMIANTKGVARGLEFLGWWLFGSVLFIAALPVALLMQPTEEQLRKKAMYSGKKKCFFCAEYIQGEAIVCKHCKRDLPSKEDE